MRFKRQVEFIDMQKDVLQMRAHAAALADQLEQVRIASSSTVTQSACGSLVQS